MTLDGHPNFAVGGGGAVLQRMVLRGYSAAPTENLGCPMAGPVKIFVCESADQSRVSFKKSIFLEKDSQLLYNEHASYGGLNGPSNLLCELYPAPFCIGGSL